MATPTSLPAAVSTGSTGTAAQFNGLRGAFRILQVVYGYTQTATSTTSGSFSNTTLSATITPQSNTSKILVLVTQNLYTNAAGTGANLHLDRDTTTIAFTVDQGFGTASGTVGMWSVNYLDSPATTSAITYKTTFARNSGAGTIYTQVNANISSITLLEVSA
jgi:hypothetical protein